VPIPAAPLQRGDRGPAVTALHRTFEHLDRQIDPAERARRSFGASTEALLRDYQGQAALPATGVFDEATRLAVAAQLGDIGPFAVYGTLTDAAGDPVAGATIFAVDVDLRRNEVLGQTTSDLFGEFEVRHTASKFTRAEKDTADLVVRAVLGDQRLAESDVWFNAPPEARVDLASRDRLGPAEIERLDADLAPLLDGTEKGDLTEEDVPFLAGETRRDPELWRAYVRAQRLAVEVKGVPPTAIYAWLRGGFRPSWEEIRRTRVGVLRSSLLDAIAKNIIPAGIADEIDSILARLGNPEHAELEELLGTAVPEEVTRKVLGSVDAVDAVSNDALSRLVESRRLEPPVADLLGLTVSLHRLAGRDTSVVSTILGTEFESVPTGRLRSTRDLVALDPEDWERALEAAGAPVPDGVSRPDHARRLAMQVAAAAPEEAFRRRVTQMSPVLETAAARFHVLARSNENALVRDFDALDLSRVPERDHAPLREAHATLRDLTNDHPGLGLHEVFAEHGAAEAVGIAAERVSWVDSVLAKNPDVSFVGLDYLPDSTGLAAVDFGELTPEARQLVVANFQSHQRTFAVTGNAIPAQELRRKGFRAASPIAALSLAEFTERSGLPAVEAAAYHATAVEITNVAAVNWFGIYEALRDGRTTPVRVIPSPEQFFRPFAGYAQLAADQPWCECESCQSVLSPAAYFVDLMYFIERHILSASFKGRESHPLHLEKRRPDLWDLELTCANTTDWVPTLDLVNEILERYLKDVVPFGDAAAIYRHLAEQERSFTQPFTLPLERLGILLEHFRLTRHDIARAMRAGADVLARTRLGLSLKAYELVTTERYTDPAFLLQLFRIDSNVTAPDGVIKPVEMSTLVRAMRMPHDTVEAIVRSAFVGTAGSGVPAIDVVFSKLDPINDVQYTSEAVHNLTLRRLDRIHRFARLWRTLTCPVGVLDHVLERLSLPGSVASIDGGTAAAPGTLERIADLLDVNATWSLRVDELMALSDEFPAGSLRGEEESLFDRLFNQLPFVSLDGAWDGAWDAGTAGRFTHPAWTGRLVAGQPPAPVGRPIPPDNTLARLLAGLQVTDGEFVELVAGLATHPSMDRRAATAAEDESIALSRDSIGALYRHARLRALLGVPVADFFQLLALARGFVTDLEDVRRVVELAAWQKTSGFTLAEITSLTAAPIVDAAARSLAKEIVDGVRAEHSLELADTLFTQLGLSETESRRFLAANLTRAANDTRPFEPYLAGYRVRAIGLGGLVNLPGPAPQLDLNAVRRLLGELSPFHVLDVALGTALGRSPDEVAALRRIADPLSSADAIAIARAIHHDAGSPTLAADTDRLETSVARMRRFDVLFAGPAFDLDGLDFAATDPAVFFGAGATAPITAPPAITLDVIRNVAAYAALATATDAGFTTASGPADRDAIQRVLVDVAAASDADLARALRTDAARIGALRPHLALPAGAFEAIAILAGCLAIANDLAVSGETLRRMVEESTPAATFDALAQAAEDVYGAFRSRYPDATTFAEKLEPFEDRLRGRKRDGLVDYITTRWPKPFADGNKLYEFFLMDVMVGGCARTSRVVAASSSLQLYLHRVLMNLEQSASWNLGDADPVGYHATFAEPLRRRECTWRQYFRTWEAARRVFLYPENYLEPELRDDKTELFEELEDTLLQTEIDKASVHDAFSRYLTGFEEIARLEIAGAHYDAAAHKLHLFGVTRDDAPVYYYREVDESDPAPARPRFSAWRKIALQIPVRKVSPVVFAGRLYVFWVETTTRSINKFADNKSTFGGYRHTLRIKYSTLRLDGAWSSPQVVTFIDKGGTAQSRVVEDPIDDVKKRRLEHDRDEIQAQLDSTDRQTRLGNAKQAVTDAQDVLNIKIGNRIGAKQRLDRFPDTGEAAAIAAAAVFGGPAAASHVFGILVAIRVGDYERTKGEEAGALQTVQLMTAIRDSLIEAEGKLKAERDRLQNEIDHLKIYVRWDPTMRDHSDALDSYRPDGWEWDRVYPEVVGTSLRITIAPRNTPRPDTVDEAQIKAYFDVYPRPLELTASEFEAYPGTIRDRPVSDQPSRAADRRLNWADGRIQLIDIASADNAMYPGQELYASTYWLNLRDKVGTTVAYAPPISEIQIVSGAPDSMIVESKGDSAWMRKNSAGNYTGLRLSTGVVDRLAEKFVLGGADELLKASFQDTLEEERSKVSPIASQSEADSANPFHPSNACLDYNRETFLHIPFLVANHHNSQDDFADAQRWYHHLFDPTAESGDPWRYREFRTPGPTTTLRKLLTREAALRAYRENPFSPHAIARTRMSAYQKAIVMKYVDNLLDWGDMLFNQFTMESVNEALMLYVMAQDILGPRPVVLGSCGEGKVTPRTYRTIHAGLSNVSDFLIELEPPPKVVTRPPGTPLYVVASHDEPVTLQQASTMEVRSLMMTAGPGAPPPPGDDGAPVGQPEGGQFVATGPVATPSVVRDLKAGGTTVWTGTSGTPLKTLRQVNGSNGNGNGYGAVGFGTVAPPIDFVEPGPDTIDVGIGVPGGQSIIPFGDLDVSRGVDLDIKYGLRDGQLPHGHQGLGKDHFTPFEVDPALMVPPKDPVFCIPPNKDLLAYWDRVEDRLFKIRNCMDISGVRRRLELFAPEIDPRLLVRMTAAGLSIDDVLNSTSGNLPPYRFTYLIDKAKQHASTVQAFGAQLLSAFEKGDAEELAHLRAVHEQNLLQMRTRLAELEIRAADDTLEGLRRQKAAVEYRRQHFLSLHAVGQIPGERKQQDLQGEASGFRTAAGIAQVVASILTIIPDTGSPFAMKFGGSQLGAAGRAVAEGLNAVAAYNEMAAARAGVEASNQRRAEEWKHQIETARLELTQIEKNVTAAEIRRDIAKHSLTVHEQTVSQSEEMFEFFREKFSSVDRYRLLQKELRRLYRMSYNSTLALARMVEQAYRAERPGDDTLLTLDYWDGQSAGLLAGERLLLDLHRLERQFIERNYRELEVEHSFSLAQFAPEALDTLRLTGECRFVIPEWFFDLTYPGQYRRRLKAVRVTLPCVTGPQVNVGATLRLDTSWMRQSVPPAAQALGDPPAVPLRHTVAIATSKAQNDAGVFEFSFRDERYMPFEGAGAISSWILSLPKTLRVFDYSTISDVVMHLDYTAQHDVGLEERWDSVAQELLTLLGDATTPELTRSFSLRTDFPDAFHRLVTGPATSVVGFELESRHFPGFVAVRGRRLEVVTASLRVVTPLRTLPATTLSIGRKTSSGMQTFKPVTAPAAPRVDGRELCEFDLGSVLKGPLDQGGVSGAVLGSYVMKLQTGVDRKSLHDILFTLAYRLAVPPP
jgi:hypothetical protein